MSNFLKVLLTVVVAVIASVVTIVSFTPDQLGAVRQEADVYTNGAQLGDEIIAWKSGKIGVGSNQVTYCPKNGRKTYFDRAEVSLAANSAGTQTASSTFLLYVATSTYAGSTDNFGTPAMSYFLVNGALIATSTNKLTLSSTSTDAGIGTLWTDDGQCVTVQMQSTFDCVANGLCEMATSTNRGFDLLYKLRFHYQK